MTETHGTRTHACCQNNDLTKMPTTPRNRQKHANPNNHHRTPVFPQTTNFSKCERKCIEKMDTHGYDGRFLAAAHDKKRLANREHNMQNELEPNHVPRTSASSRNFPQMKTSRPVKIPWTFCRWEHPTFWNRHANQSSMRWKLPREQCSSFSMPQNFGLCTANPNPSPSLNEALETDTNMNRSFAANGGLFAPERNPMEWRPWPHKHHWWPNTERSKSRSDTKQMLPLFEEERTRKTTPTGKTQTSTTKQIAIQSFPKMGI